MILVACEYSGVVREALRAKGLEAVSCDLLPSELPGPHIEGDVLELLRGCRFEAILAFPPCTYLARSGIHWNSRIPGRAAKTAEAVNFVRALWDASDIVCVENPIGVLSTQWRKPSQKVQPYEYGHSAVKTTCLWLKGLPNLEPTNVVEASGFAALDYRGPRATRAKERSRTYAGVAEAMASQWLPYLRGDKKHTSPLR